MKITLKSILAPVLIAATVFSASAQKIGYLNASMILADMSEVKAADSQLEAFSKQMRNKDSVQVVAFQTKYQDLAKQKDAGSIAPIELEKRSKDLETERTQIEQFEQDMAKQVQDRRKDLYTPVIDKVNKAITEISKEQGYAYVIDATSGILLYADEKNDISALVRTKLGLPAATTAAAGMSADKKK